VARWRRGKVEIATGPALTASSESLLAESAARWLEGYLLASPAEIGLALVRSLLLDEIKPGGS
jgi:hypothetical protein